MAFRILSLDGGGSWALIQVRALMKLYDEATTGHKILSDFDLVAANSGGSLVLAGLVEDLSLSDLLGYFADEAKRRSIFSPTTSPINLVLQNTAGIGPKYSAEAKLPALEQLLPKSGDAMLSKVIEGVRRPGAAADVHLLIVGFDYDRNRAKFFRSAPTGGAGGLGAGAPSDVTLAEAVHASANPPVNYFDAPAVFPIHPGRYWDGGITGCNNPVLAAVTEALCLGQQPGNVAALSIGTGNVVLPLAQAGQAASQAPYTQALSDPGIVNDLAKLATSILDDPPDMASFIAHVMLGANAGVKAPAQSRVVRMNPLISPIGEAGSWTSPEGMTAAQFIYLSKLPMDAIEPVQVNAIAAFADLWLQNHVRNQPIRINGDTLECELGYESFADAAAAWAAIK